MTKTATKSIQVYMKLIVLTGGIACGKSTAAKIFSEDYHIPIVDSDLIVHELQKPGKPFYNKIIENFGTDVLKEDKTLDRKKLGSIVFNDASKRRVLNSITHSLVFRELIFSTIKLWISRHPIVIVDIPLFFEAKMPKSIFDDIINVYSNPEIQLQRLMNRNQFTLEEATSRIKSQIPGEKKCQMATIVINNDGTEEELREQIRKIVDKWNASSKLFSKYPDPLLVLIIVVVLVLFIIFLRYKD